MRSRTVWELMERLQWAFVDGLQARGTLVRFLPAAPYFPSANYPFPTLSLFGLVESTPPTGDLGFTLT